MNNALCPWFPLWAPPPTARLHPTFRPTQDVVRAIRAPLARRGGGLALDCVRFTADGAHAPVTLFPMALCGAPPQIALMDARDEPGWPAVMDLGHREKPVRQILGRYFRFPSPQQKWEDQRGVGAEMLPGIFRGMKVGHGAPPSRSCVPAVCWLRTFPER